ncbi:MAG: large repetitive protein, partial [Actinoplanes sp.]|nr:large repetitive protein [Actinoplanes sp.]
SGLVGATIGGLSGLGGALGGKLLSAVGGRALRAVGGLFGRGAEAATEGASTAASEGAAEGTAESAATSAENSSASRAADEPGAGTESESPGCGGAPHSFTGSTRVLLADGTTKAIDHVKVGDKIKSAVPGSRKLENHKVKRVIVTTTDHDFVDLTIAPKRSGKLAQAAVALAAGVAAVAGPATLTTTFHHPFYDKTQASFADAADLKVGDDLQTASGTAVVLAKRTYHTTAVTYDLTINSLHTYYVLAGTTPVLVHNCGPDLDALSQSGQRAAKGGRTAAGRAYQKHMDRGELDPVPGAKLDESGQNLLDDILTNPATTQSPVTSGGFQGGTRFTMPGPQGQQGYGATFDQNGAFQYFGRY